jgi:hypothetical protein
MVSLEALRMRVALIAIVLVASLPAIGSPQPVPASAAEEQRRVIAERIEEARAKGGAYAKELIDPLTSLAELYRESGDHDLAVAVTDQALQVIRANYGLRSLDQAPLIRERIRSEEARGNAAEAWDLEQALLTLARANLGDVRSAEVFKEIGDKRMDLLRRFDAGEFLPQVELGCYFEKCTFGSRKIAARAMLADAQGNYSAAIRVLLVAGQYSSAELEDLELDLVKSTYWYGGPYQTGRQSLRRLIAYDVANAQPLVNRADALLQIGDWDLLYERRALALDTYEATYEFLKREGVERAAIDALFLPELPIVLPVFQSNPLATSPSDEHVDVSFEITRYGFAERVKVLAKTPNVSDEAEERLVRLIEGRRFRPRVVDGELPRSTPVELRYYVSD